MIKKVLFLLLIGSLLTMTSYAQTATITIKVTMPQVISTDAEDTQDEEPEALDEESESLDEEYGEIAIVQETLRDGEFVIVKSIVAK